MSPLLLASPNRTIKAEIAEVSKLVENIDFITKSEVGIGSP